MRYLTAGETHGKCLIGIIEGIPSNLPIDIQHINNRLSLRQSGYGRGGRMKIENDRVEILSGVRHGKTLGSPIALKIENKDWENWKETMSPDDIDAQYVVITKPRPGHADLAGSIKYRHNDIRSVLERASARETAMRTAIGCIGEQLLNKFGITVLSHVTGVGPYNSSASYNDKMFGENLRRSQLGCADPNAEADIIKYIDKIKSDGDSVGGIFEVICLGLPVGLGSYVHWDRKLDGKIAGALMSIQAIKGIEFGDGFGLGSIPGSKAHDEIFFSGQYYRETNHAGGVEGGMTNGQPLVVRCVMKPIPTLYKPLRSVDIVSKTPFEAGIERSDVCAVPAACVVGHSVVAWEVACALTEKLGGDSLQDMQTNSAECTKHLQQL